MPYSLQIVCGLFCVLLGCVNSEGLTGLQFKVLIREDLKVLPFAGVVKRVALSPHLF